MAYMDKQAESQRFAINITVTPEEYEFVRLKAYLNRTSMAGYLRRLIAKEKGKETDGDAAKIKETGKA
jgi:hypothetical protein